MYSNDPNDSNDPGDDLPGDLIQISEPRFVQADLRADRVLQEVRGIGAAPEAVTVGEPVGDIGHRGLPLVAGACLGVVVIAHGMFERLGQLPLTHQAGADLEVPLFVDGLDLLRGRVGAPYLMKSRDSFSSRSVPNEEAHADILCDPDGGPCIRLLIGGQ